jgi:hypothetical protein
MTITEQDEPSSGLWGLVLLALVVFLVAVLILEKHP